LVNLSHQGALNMNVLSKENQKFLDRRKNSVTSSASSATSLTVNKALGAKVWDVDGKEYIDFAGGIGSLNAGHNHPEVVEAIKRQADNLIQPCFHVMQHPGFIELSEKLNELVLGDFKKKTYLCNSGAEAVENGIKIARHYTKRAGVICFEGAFHGRTLLGMSLTSKIMPYKKDFGPFSPEIYRAQHPALHSDITFDYDAYWQDLFNCFVSADNVAAIIIEPQLGEGGFIPVPVEFMHSIRKVCDQNGIVMIADEVQTGFCRTGKMLAMEHYEIAPDLTLMAKSLSAGIPLAAVTGKVDIMDSPHVGGIGSTNGGNPLACAAALALLDVYKQENLAHKAEIIGNKTKTFFKDLQGICPQIKDIRGLGAMVGVEFIDDQGKPNSEFLSTLINKCLQKGLVLLSAGVHKNVLRTLMPLVITEHELLGAFKIIQTSVREINFD
jgi:4-aminobutyrate aminotransferase/(S)-3-amino-2-methylpropionate transaminase